MRKILIGVFIVAAFFGGTLWALEALWPDSSLDDKRPALTELPPLRADARTSQITAPIAVAMNAIRDRIDAAAPRNLEGKRDNPLSELLGKADIGWTIERGRMTVAGRPPESVAIATTVNGSMRVTGQIANQAGNLTGAITGLLGAEAGRNIGNLATRALDQRADIRGNVTVTSRPQLTQNWRIEPNLSGQVTIADGGLTIAGVKLNVASEVKPLLDRTVNDQMAVLANQLRDDPTLEQTARREWTKLCRSISLGAASAGAPNLWLEVRPTKAYAAQPRMTADWAIFTVGVQAETRIGPSQTKPTCPFPSRIEFVPQTDQGRIAVAVPIDLPFTELNKLLDKQLEGKTLPGDGSGPVEVKVRRAQLAASGDRLLISLRIKAKERASWFGLGANATVHLWGKPTLDRAQQIVRLTDITLDVELKEAFGLLGAAARAAIPYIESTIQEQAVLDLKPFIATARASIEAAAAEFQKQADGVKAETAVTGLRLVGIEFDSKTLRVIAEADGTARALVTKLGAQ